MTAQDQIYQNCLRILREELVMAMGCTEPIAVAYAAARAREVLGALPDSVLVQASGSIIKNVKSVIVPHTGGRRGIGAAAAAGVLYGNAEGKLEALSGASEEDVAGLQPFLERTPVKVEYLNDGHAFSLAVRVSQGEDYALVHILDHHTNVVRVEKNEEVLLDRACGAAGENSGTDLDGLTMEQIWDFAQSVEIADIKELLDRQIQCNLRIAKEGLQGSYGANIGQVLLKTNGDTVRTRAKAMAAAGSDARMNGCELPVVINSGSGNQGITCSVPILVYAQELGSSDEEIYRALALSDLIAIYEKSGIGTLSAYCGAVTAGAAAGAGVAYLHGGGYSEVKHTVVNALAIVSGIVCDGAKASCAAKIAAAVDAGLLGYEMYQNGQQFYSGDGIVAAGVDQTIRNIGILGRVGMQDTNHTIIELMMQ